jgi:hypothetical protein
MLTIFTTCKPFEGEFSIIQRNAITSWTKLGENIQIIIVGNEKGVKEISSELNITNIPVVKRNSLGTPYLDDIFNQAKKIAKYDILCYINADIILTPSAIDVVKFISSKFKNFLIVGRRWNTPINFLLDFSDNNWDKKLKEYVKANGKLDLPGAIDYFIFNKDLYQNIPPFLIGRTAWDNYLVGRAILKTPFVFDATDSIFAVHQMHSYNHHPDGAFGIWHGEENRYNNKIAKTPSLVLPFGSMKKTLLRIKTHNGSLKITINPNALVKNVFSYLKGLGIR